MLKKNQYVWIYGYHSVAQALKNTKRKHKTLLITKESYDKHQTTISPLAPNINIQISTKAKITELLPKGANHQNIALHTSNPSKTDIEEILTTNSSQSTVLILDQVTDIGNIGAILRSAAAFEVDAVVLTRHHAPNHSIISKTASGALETVPLIYVNNIASTMRQAKQQGYWCYGMDEKSSTALQQVQFDRKCVIVLGSEGSGLRRLTKEQCDCMVRIPISANVNSLNVSNAAAIILHSLYITN